MGTISSILNTPGQFHVIINGKQYDFIGTLRTENWNNWKDVISLYGEMDDTVGSSEFDYIQQIWGSIRAQGVTLLDSVIEKTFCLRDDRTIFIMRCIPYKIIVGKEYSGDINNISTIVMRSDSFNNLFSQQIVRQMHFYTRENPAILLRTYSGEIGATDEDGKLNLYQEIISRSSSKKIEYDILSCIKYCARQPCSIKDILEKITMAQTLIGLFSDHPIKIKSIQFCTNDETYPKNAVPEKWIYFNFSENIYDDERDDRGYDICLLKSDRFCKEFSSIWNNWLGFYENNKCIAILFSEIISNRTTGVNCFLNLCQALEVYSVHYRDSQSRRLMNRDMERRGVRPPKQIYLRYRLQDIIGNLERYICVDDSTIIELAKKISTNRNYFTHYNDKITRPKFYEVDACSRFLRFVLLATVYLAMGVKSESIYDMKKNFELKWNLLKYDIETILTKPEK